LYIEAKKKHKIELTIKQKLTAVKKWLTNNSLYKEVKYGGFLTWSKYVTAQSTNDRKLVYITVDEDNKEYFIDFEIWERKTTLDKGNAQKMVYKSKITQWKLPDDEEEDKDDE